MGGKQRLKCVYLGAIRVIGTPALKTDLQVCKSLSMRISELSNLEQLHLSRPLYYAYWNFDSFDMEKMALGLKNSDKSLETFTRHSSTLHRLLIND